jgi:hypothetical protein
VNTHEKGPQPEPLRFFGTTWVAHDRGYGWRRAGVAAGSLVAAVFGAAVLVLGFAGLADAHVGLPVMVLVVGAFAVCTVLAGWRTWQEFTGRVPPREHREYEVTERGPKEEVGRGLYLIGIVGVLLAYFLRSLVEAPGERLQRERYEAARHGTPPGRDRPARRRRPR